MTLRAFAAERRVAGAVPSTAGVIAAERRHLPSIFPASGALSSKLAGVLVLSIDKTYGQRDGRADKQT